MAESTPKSEVGVLVDDDIRELLRDGHISAAVTVDDFQVQPASLDLRLGCVRVCVCVCVCVYACVRVRDMTNCCFASLFCCFLFVGLRAARSNVAIRIRASFLVGKFTVQQRLAEFEMHRFSLENGFVAHRTLILLFI